MDFEPTSWKCRVGSELEGCEFRLWSDRIRTLGPKVGKVRLWSEFTPLQLGTNLDSQVEVTQIVNPSRIAISEKGVKQRTVGDKQRT